jgi:hypothetical protein
MEDLTESFSPPEIVSNELLCLEKKNAIKPLETTSESDHLGKEHSNKNYANEDVKKVEVCNTNCESPVEFARQENVGNNDAVSDLLPCITTCSTDELDITITHFNIPICDSAHVISVEMGNSPISPNETDLLILSEVKCQTESGNNDEVSLVENATPNDATSLALGQENIPVNSPMQSYSIESSACCEEDTAERFRFVEVEYQSSVQNFAAEEEVAKQDTSVELNLIPHQDTVKEEALFNNEILRKKSLNEVPMQTEVQFSKHTICETADSFEAQIKKPELSEEVIVPKKNCSNTQEQVFPENSETHILTTKDSGNEEFLFGKAKCSKSITGIKSMTLESHLQEFTEEVNAEVLKNTTVNISEDVESKDELCQTTDMSVIPSMPCTECVEKNGEANLEELTRSPYNVLLEQDREESLSMYGTISPQKSTDSSEVHKEDEEIAIKKDFALIQANVMSPEELGLEKAITVAVAPIESIETDKKVPILSTTSEQASLQEHTNNLIKNNNLKAPLKAEETLCENLISEEAATTCDALEMCYDILQEKKDSTIPAKTLLRDSAKSKGVEMTLEVVAEQLCGTVNVMTDVEVEIAIEKVSSSLQEIQENKPMSHSEKSGKLEDAGVSERHEIESEVAERNLFPKDRESYLSDKDVLIQDSDTFQEKKKEDVVEAEKSCSTNSEWVTSVNLPELQEETMYANVGEVTNSSCIERKSECSSDEAIFYEAEDLLHVKIDESEVKTELSCSETGEENHNEPFFDANESFETCEHERTKTELDTAMQDKNSLTKCNVYASFQCKNMIEQRICDNRKLKACYSLLDDIMNKILITQECIEEVIHFLESNSSADQKCKDLTLSVIRDFQNNLVQKTSDKTKLLSDYSNIQSLQLRKNLSDNTKQVVILNTHF